MRRNLQGTISNLRLCWDLITFAMTSNANSMSTRLQLPLDSSRLTQFARLFGARRERSHATIFLIPAFITFES